MTKAEILAKLEEYKDRPIEIAINGGGDITFYGNIEGHWILTKGDYMVAVSKNTVNGIRKVNQNESPFSITTFGFEEIAYIRSYLTIDTIENDLAGLTPAGTDKSLADIVKEIESDSINKANSTRGFSNDAVYGSERYGRFRGSAISTSIDGLPSYLKDKE